MFRGIIRLVMMLREIRLVMTFLLLVDLLLSHHPIKGVEGSAGGGAGVIRTGRGRKVQARFGEGKFVEENKGDVEKGKGKENAEGREMAVERREREVEEKEENVMREDGLSIREDLTL